MGKANYWDHGFEDDDDDYDPADWWKGNNKKNEDNHIHIPPSSNRIGNVINGNKDNNYVNPFIDKDSVEINIDSDVGALDDQIDKLLYEQYYFIEDVCTLFSYTEYDVNGCVQFCVMDRGSNVFYGIITDCKSTKKPVCDYSCVGSSIIPGSEKESNLTIAVGDTKTVHDSFGLWVYEYFKKHKKFQKYELYYEGCLFPCVGYLEVKQKFDMYEWYSFLKGFCNCTDYEEFAYGGGIDWFTPDEIITHIGSPIPVLRTMYIKRIFKYFMDVKITREKD